MFLVWDSELLSLFQFWQSEPPSCLRFGVQSHHSHYNSVFKATISSQLRRSESPFTVWISEPLSLFNFGLQSHYFFLVLIFEVTISSQFGHSEPLSLFNLTFKVVVHTHSGIFESLSFLFFDVQSHFSSALSFRVIAHGIQFHWHCTSYLHDFAFVLVFLTSLPCAYRLFIMLS